MSDGGCAREPAPRRAEQLTIEIVDELRAVARAQDSDKRSACGVDGRTARGITVWSGVDALNDVDHYETRLMNWYGPGSGAYVSEAVSRLLNVAAE